MGQTDLDRVKMTQSEASETLSFSCSTVQICSICSMFNFVQFVQCSNLFNLFNVQICSICSMFKFVQFFNVQICSIFQCSTSRWSRIVAVVSSPGALCHLNLYLDLTTSNSTSNSKRSRFACNVHTPHAATHFGGQPTQKKFKSTGFQETIYRMLSARISFVRIFKILVFWHNVPTLWDSQCIGRK